MANLKDKSPHWIVVSPNGSRHVKSEEFFELPEVKKTMEELSKIRPVKDSSGRDVMRLSGRIRCESRRISVSDQCSG